MTRRPGEQVLGLHPSSRGFGWVFFDAPCSAFDWGTADIRKNKNAEALARIRQLLKRYRPHVVAMEAFADGTRRRATRIVQLYLTIENEACRGAVVARFYPRAAIQTVLDGAQTRQEVAVRVAELLPVLKHRLPAPRKPWHSERANTALFAAAACALAHFAMRDDKLP